MSSYEEALKAAGIEVILFESFGSYQGDWWAKVKVGNDTGWINGAYGSCSSCDALEAEVGSEPWGSGPDDPNITEEDRLEWQDYKVRLREFGERYMSDLKTKEEALKIASENIEWDLDAEVMVKFIEEN